MVNNMRSLLVVFITLLLSSCSRTEEVGKHCQCAATESPQQALRSYNAVFTGKVTSTHKINWYDYKAHFKVEKAWKGVDWENVTVHSTTFLTSCGYVFEKGKEYLVYAYLNDGILYVHRCSRTKLLKDAAEDFEGLGEPKRRFE